MFLNTQVIYYQDDWIASQTLIYQRNISILKTVWDNFFSFLYTCIFAKNLQWMIICFIFTTIQLKCYLNLFYFDDVMRII